jgi:predicted nucleic acid-binding protein
LERLAAQQPRRDADGLIAATARVHDLILVTRNVRDFEDTGIHIRNPWDLQGLQWPRLLAIIDCDGRTE